MGVLTVLITGASGFIGARLSRLLATRCCVAGTYLTNEVVRVAGVKYYRLDVIDSDGVWKLVRDVQPDIVVHVAGTKDIGFCAEHREQAWLVHAVGTRNVVQACADVQARIVYISTDCVFDGAKELYSENDATDPFNVYGQVKLEGEKTVLTRGLDAAVIRASLLFGWCLPGQASNTVMDVIRSAQCHLPISLPTTLFNTPLYVGEAVHAIGSIALSSLSGVFHVAGRERLSRFALALATARTFGLDTSEILPTESTTGLRPLNSCLDPSGVEQALGVRFSSAQEGLERMRREPRVPAEISVTQNDTGADGYQPRSL
jgi:dTDP-4-dehydrorhamnose reductase